jgi:hypothetical protein
VNGWPALLQARQPLDKLILLAPSVDPRIIISISRITMAAAVQRTVTVSVGLVALAWLVPARFTTR